VPTVFRVLPRLLAALIMAAAVVLFNRDVLVIRLAEIDALLRDASQTEHADVGQLLFRYRILAERSEQGIDRSDQLPAEAILAVMDDETPEPTSPREYEQMEASIAFQLLNGLRDLIGKPPLVLRRDETMTDQIARAYMLERARRWPEAVEAYRRTLNLPDLNDMERATLRLHLGFCLSMDGRTDEARLVFVSLTDTMAGTEYALAANEMINYLDRIALSGDSDSFAIPGKSDFFVLQYRTAIEELDRFVATQPEVSIEAEARYYRARALEEIGRFDEAVAEYERISFLPAPRWQRAAARRLVVIADYYRPDDELRSRSIALLHEYDDEEFLSIADRFRDTRVPAATAAGVPTTPGLDDAEPRETATPKPAELWIRTHPVSARVTIRSIGERRTPLIVSDLSAGEYSVTVEADGYRREVVSLDIAAGERRVVELTLSPAPMPEVPAPMPAQIHVPAQTPAQPPAPALSARSVGEPAMRPDPWISTGSIAASNDESRRDTPVTGARSRQRSSVRDVPTPAASEPAPGGAPEEQVAGDDRDTVAIAPGPAADFPVDERERAQPPAIPDEDAAPGPSPRGASAVEEMPDDGVPDEQDEPPPSAEGAGREEVPGDEPAEPRVFDAEIDDYALIGRIVGIGEDGSFFVDIEAIHLRDRANRLYLFGRDGAGERPSIVARRTAVVDHTMIARLLDPSLANLLEAGAPVYISR